MTLKYWAFMYLMPGCSPDTHTIESNSNGCKLKIIGLDVFCKELSIKIACQLVSKGVQTIELCGGFGPTWITKISEAINYKIPVGGVMYGPEFRKPLFDLMQFKKNL